MAALWSKSIKQLINFGLEYVAKDDETRIIDIKEINVWVWSFFCILL